MLIGFYQSPVFVFCVFLLQCSRTVQGDVPCPIWKEVWEGQVLPSQFIFFFFPTSIYNLYRKMCLKVQPLIDILGNSHPWCIRLTLLNKLGNVFVPPFYGSARSSVGSSGLLWVGVYFIYVYCILPESGCIVAEFGSPSNYWVDSCDFELFSPKNIRIITMMLFLILLILLLKW